MGIQITDIANYMPIDNSKKFCLDTNVLYWYTYPRYTLFSNRGTEIRGQGYYDFVDKLVANGNPLITTRYNISELINIIEKHEYDIFCAEHSNLPYTKKDFRRISQQRQQLKQTLKITMSNVNSICTVADFNFTENILNECIDTLDKHRCDVFDFAILSYFKNNNLTNIITDDSDFSSVDGIHLFTANSSSITSR